MFFFNAKFITRYIPFKNVTIHHGKLFNTITFCHYSSILDPRNILSSLKSRNLLFQHTDNASQHLSSKCTIYAGFDPTSDGLHLGNLLVLQTLKHFKNLGHKVVGLVGGGTGLIGDPSGKTQERPLLQVELIDKNVQALKKEISTFLGKDAIVVDNGEWLRQMTMVDLLRDVGKHFYINNMLRAETVKTRLELASTEQAGMTFTEFTYPLLQAYDFYYLNEKYGVTMQLGGSDQWGNIVAGMDYIKRKTGKLVGGITVPLLTTADGKKFGKSEGNAIFLNPEKTSVYEFYQYFMRIQDEDIGKLLRMLTNISLDEIQKIEEEHYKCPDNRFGQKELARIITTQIHGKEAFEKAKKSSEILFGDSEITGLSSNEIQALFHDAPCAEISENELFNLPLPILVKTAKMIQSSSQANKLISSGGFYINNRRVTDRNYKIQKSDLIDNQIVVLRAGKKKYYIIKKI